MISKKSIILILISVYSFSVGTLDAHASNAFSGLETQITPASDSTIIKKMQLALNEFDLYSGEIDGNYSSVESSLMNYQKNTGIIKDSTDYGAGYFGIKTLTALKEDFPNKFKEISEKHLKADKPSSGIRNFYVTAYYSPVLGQSRYTTGTYFGDIKLNGSGKSTASGKKVFEGLIAAPKNYAFGTKIELEGLGVGIVEDRGGSIVNGGTSGNDYDRIDVWMGYGDEGLTKALKWGKRKVKGKIITDGVETPIQKINLGNNDENLNKVNNEFSKKQEDILLSKDAKDKLFEINLKITANIEKMYGKNTLESIKYRNDLKVVIDTHAARTKDDLKKKQLNYLKSLI